MTPYVVHLVPLESGFVVPLGDHIKLVNIEDEQTLAAQVSNISLRGVMRRRVNFYRKFSVSRATKVQELLKKYNEYSATRRPFDDFNDLLNASYEVLKPLRPSEWFYLQHCSNVAGPTHKAFIRQYCEIFGSDFVWNMEPGKADPIYSRLVTLSNAIRPVETGQVSFTDNADHFDRYSILGNEWYQLFEKMMSPEMNSQKSIETRFVHLFINTIFRGYGRVYDL